MDFKEIINKRRAVNHFDPMKDVPESLIKSIVETASRTPSGFNLQPWILIVLKNPEENAKLRKLAWNQEKVTQAPVVLIVLADRDAWREEHPFVQRTIKEMVKAGTMEEGKHQWFIDAARNLYGENKEKQQAFACKNTGFFAMSLMLAAKDMGLDTHPMDGFDHESVRKEFHIPENYWIPLLIAVGYFDKEKELSPPKWRKTYDEIIVNFHVKEDRSKEKG